MAGETTIVPKPAPSPAPTVRDGSRRRELAALATGFIGVAWIGVGASTHAGKPIAVGAAFLLAAIVALIVEAVRRS